MGMFDYVEIPCPSCGHINLQQSKGGPCRLNTYSIYGVPLNVLGDIINDEIVCSQCGKKLKLQVAYLVHIIIDRNEDNNELSNL